MGQLQILNSDRREPYCLLYQNIRSLVTMNSKKKIDYLKEYTQEHGNETSEQSELLNTQTHVGHTPQRDDVHKNKNISQTNLDNRPWKIVLQNTRGLVTENSNKRLETIKEYAKDEKILLMNITETWFHKTIKEVNIDGYNIYRCGRKEKQRGGTAI